MKRFCYLILNYETYEETLACAESVRQIAGAGLAEGRDRIVIVDNGSSEANLAGLKKGLAALDYEKSVAEESIPSYVTLIEAGKNLGFAKGNNLGFVYAKEHWDPDFIVMMNNDIVLTQNDLEERVEFLYDRYGFAVCGGDWTDPAGEIRFNPQVTKETDFTAVEGHIADKMMTVKYCRWHVEPAVAAGRRLMNRGREEDPVLRKLWARIAEKTAEGQEHIAVRCTPKNRLQLHGCMLIFSRDYISLFSGLYDGTFLYYEEDFLRIRCERTGLKMYFFPELTAVHKESATENAVVRSVNAKHRARAQHMIDSLYLLREYIKDPSMDEEASAAMSDAMKKKAKQAVKDMIAAVMAGQDTRNKDLNERFAGDADEAAADAGAADAPADGEAPREAGTAAVAGTSKYSSGDLTPGSAKGLTDKKISIAMTTYNGIQYVVEQLDSLLAQTLPADEIIIRDDCSPDGTWEVLEQYVKSHPEAPIRIELNEQNLGYKKNFHRVLGEVTGDYIFLCDQDDNWNPDKLEICVRVMEEHPEILSLNTSFEFMDSHDQPIETVLLKGRANNNIVRAEMEFDELRCFGTEAIVLANLSPGCTMCIRKEQIGEFVASYNFTLPHDYFINLAASLKNGTYYLNTPTIRYRIHDKNTIGLILVEHDDTPSFYDIKVKGNLVTRLEEAQQLVDIFDAVWDSGIEKKWSGSYRTFLRRRRDYLENRSLPGFFWMLSHWHL
ncbi:MAG: glycosyltransferase, partial [Lachnospiraceae bacterium]|nr:glycosyltransferase [Lachnospiraceae bacterium]